MIRTIKDIIDYFKKSRVEIEWDKIFFAGFKGKPNQCYDLGNDPLKTMFDQKMKKKKLC